MARAGRWLAIVVVGSFTLAGCRKEDESAALSARADESACWTEAQRRTDGKGESAMAGTQYTQPPAMVIVPLFVSSVGV